MINRTIAITIWPHLFRVDAVHMRYFLPIAKGLGWTLTAGAALLTLSSVLAPLGLYDEIVPGKSKLVAFEYFKDPSP